MDGQSFPRAKLLEVFVLQSFEIMESNPYHAPGTAGLSASLPISDDPYTPPIAFYLALAIVLAGTLMVCAQATTFIEGLFAVPFTFGPLLLALIPMWTCRTTASQFVLVLADIAYAVWFLYVYLDVFVWHPGPNSPIALIFIGFYSVPALLLLCIIAGLIHFISRARKARSRRSHVA